MPNRFAATSRWIKLLDENTVKLALLLFQLEKPAWTLKTIIRKRARPLIEKVPSLDPVTERESIFRCCLFLFLLLLPCQKGESEKGEMDIRHFSPKKRKVFGDKGA